MSRETCQTCQRPTALCYCCKVKLINNRIKVTILQHPSEAKHPFNTGKIINQCLNNSQIIIKNNFSQSELTFLLSQTSAILYPSMPWLPKVEQVVIELSKDDNDSHYITNQRFANSIEHLVLLDASWRKSKRFMFQHPQLTRLPRISLNGQFKSNYRIRKSKIKASLSSVESVYEALKALEPNTRFESLIEVFEHMVDLQLQHSQSLPPR